MRRARPIVSCWPCIDRPAPTRPPVPAPEIDEEREERLARVIVVDCYNEYEAWQGRWCHLDGKPTGPFQAECIRVRRGLPL